MPARRSCRMRSLRKLLPDHRYVARFLSVIGDGLGGELLKVSGGVQEEVLGLSHQIVYEYGRHLSARPGHRMSAIDPKQSLSELRKGLIVEPVNSLGFCNKEP